MFDQIDDVVAIRSLFAGVAILQECDLDQRRYP